MEFNWITVERELRLLENPGIYAEQAREAIENEPVVQGEIVAIEAKLDRILEEISELRKAYVAKSAT